MEVIVLDGDQRPALAITRSLGKRGIRVTVGAETGTSLASRSRYCAGSFVYPSPYLDPEGFFRTIEDRTRSVRHAVLFPVTDVSLGEVLSERDAFHGEVAIPFEGIEKFRLVSDKAWVVSQCRMLGLPIPRTILSTDCASMEDLILAAKGFGYPLVVKPSLSRIRTKTGWMDTKVQYAKDEEELRKIITLEPFSTIPFLLQERIQGPGVGIFLLLQDGDVLASFAHMRIREKPPSGGVSVLCESIEPPSGTLTAASRLLGEIGWNGIAMVEFKIDELSGVPRILEVNARFWGSLELAVSAGVDFPHLLFRMACGEKMTETVSYRKGLKLRWELGDLDHLWLRLSKNGSRLFLPSGAPSLARVVGDFIFDTFRPSVRTEVFRLNDAGPFLHELGRYVRNAVSPRSRIDP